MAPKRWQTWVVCYVCVLSSLLNMYARVDAMVQTDHEVSGWKDEEVRLRCDFDDPDPFAVLWGKVNDSNPDDINNKARFLGGKMDSFADRFSMNPDYSLSISQLRVFDEGRYACQLETQDSVSYKNFTQLHIKALSSKPIIPLCNKKTPEDYHHHCTLTTSLTELNIECNAAGFRPNVTLEWSDSTNVLPPTGNPFQRTLSDGTYERFVTIAVIPREDEDQNFTCTVRGEATNGEDWSTTVTVPALPEPAKGPPELAKGLPAGGIAALVTFVAILMLVVVMFLLALILRKFNKLPAQGEAVLNRIPFLKKESKPIPETERLVEQSKRLDDIRENLRNYRLRKPAELAGSSQHLSAHIGLFGVMNAGKSSFINSLLRAFTGTGASFQATGHLESAGGKPNMRSRSNFTEHISIYDNRGMPDFNINNLPEIISQMRGERGTDPTQTIERSADEEIHCAVFVYKLIDDSEDKGKEFLEAFSKNLLHYNGYPPMIVITHSDSILTLKDLKKKLRWCGVQKNVWFFENYTAENNTDDVDKNVELLMFLQSALHQCDGTIVNTEREKRQKPIQQQTSKKSMNRMNSHLI